MPTKGISPAAMTMGSKEWVAVAWRASEIVADQVEGEDGADSGAGSAQAADGGDGFAGEEVGGQNVGDGGERCVGESG